MKKLFNINERLNRKEYFLYGLLPMVLFILVVDSFLVGLIHSMVLILLFLFLFILLLVSSVKRARDTGLRAFYSFLFFGTLPIFTFLTVVQFNLSINVFYAVCGLLVVYLVFMPSSKKELKALKQYESIIVFITIPLLIVVLVQMIVPHTSCVSEHSKRSLVCLNMKGYAHALEIYKEDNGDYPTTKEGANALINHPYKYLERIPRDSWQGNILYERTEKGFELISYGADRKEGGEDEYADIYYSGCDK